MFKSIRKGGRIAAVALGLVAALTPPAALADGAPTPELERSFTVKCDKDSVVSVYPLDGINDRAIVTKMKEYSGGVAQEPYALMNLKDGSMSHVTTPKDSDGPVGWAPDYHSYGWFVDNGFATYSLDKQQTDIHPYKIRAYEHKSLMLTSDGNKALIGYSGSDYKTNKIDIYDLGSNSVTQSCSFTADDSDYSSGFVSEDGSRLYLASVDTDSKTVKLKIIDTSDGSASIKTTHVDGSAKHLAISNIKQYESNSFLIQGGNYLIKADRDGNMDVIQNDSSHAFANAYTAKAPSAWNCNNDDYYTVYKRSGSKKLYAKSDDGSSYVDTDNADLSVCAIDDGREVGTIKYPFKDGGLCGLSDDGSVLLGYSDKADKEYLTLVDSQTGAKSETKIDADSFPSMRFLHGDREILVTYTDKKDDSVTHIDIYKSNIPHSVIGDALYFAQNNLPVVIGGGVVLVLVIGGVMVVSVRRRKKRSGSTDNAAGAAPKAKKQKRSRHRKNGQQEDTCAAPAGVATQQTVNQPAVPAPQSNMAPSASSMPTQQPTWGAPQQPTPQPSVATPTPRFCRHCGSPLTPGSKFCPKCGHPIE